MEDFSITLTPAMLALVPVVAALLQFAKRLDFVQEMKQWLPLISIGIALGIGYATKMPNPIMNSIVIGLVASGGYDLLKVPAK